MWIKFYKSLLYTNPYPQNNLILGPNTNINEQKKKKGTNIYIFVFVFS